MYGTCSTAMQFGLLATWCSALMDCVGCEKCRLWGKLQVIGIGTALKILFSVDDQSNMDPHVSILYSFHAGLTEGLFI